MRRRTESPYIAQRRREASAARVAKGLAPLSVVANEEAALAKKKLLGEAKDDLRQRGEVQQTEEKGAEGPLHISSSSPTSVPSPLSSTRTASISATLAPPPRKIIASRPSSTRQETGASLFPQNSGGGAPSSSSTVPTTRLSSTSEVAPLRKPSLTSGTGLRNTPAAASAAPAAAGATKTPPPQPSPSATAATHDEAFDRVNADGKRKRFDLQLARAHGIMGVGTSDFILDVGVPLPDAPMLVDVKSAAGAASWAGVKDEKDQHLQSLQSYQDDDDFSCGDFRCHVFVDLSEVMDAHRRSLADGGFGKGLGRGGVPVVAEARPKAVDSPSAPQRDTEEKGAHDRTVEENVQATTSKTKKEDEKTLAAIEIGRKYFSPQGRHRRMWVKGVPSPDSFRVTGQETATSVRSERVFVETDVTPDHLLENEKTDIAAGCTYRVVRGVIVGYLDSEWFRQNELVSSSTVPSPPPPSASSQPTPPFSAIDLLTKPVPGRVVLMRPRAPPPPRSSLAADPVAAACNGGKGKQPGANNDGDDGGLPYCIPIDLSRTRVIRCAQCKIQTANDGASSSSSCCDGIVPIDELSHHEVGFHRQPSAAATTANANV